MRTGGFFSGTHPRCFSHRGGAALHPENTLAAFRYSLDLGIEYIETDVHGSADGQLVVFHDARLERTTNGHGFLRDHTLAELQQLDAGYHFSPDGSSKPERGRGHHILRFEDLVELDQRVRFNVELKAPGLAEEMCRVIEKHDLFERILIAAADDAVMHEYRSLGPGAVPTSAATREVLRFWAAARMGATRFLEIEYAALQVPARQGPLTVVDPRFVRAAHARDVEVHVWTVDDPREMARLLALGVDGLMSDRPDLLQQRVGGDDGVDVRRSLLSD